MSGPNNTDSDDAAMRARLAALKTDLAAGGRAPAGTGPAKGPGSMGSALNLGARVMSEFVAAVAVGAFIGWQIDRWLGSSPAALIIFVALGTAAGFWSVYRVATKPMSK